MSRRPPGMVYALRCGYGAGACTEGTWCSCSLELMKDTSARPHLAGGGAPAAGAHRPRWLLRAATRRDVEPSWGSGHSRSDWGHRRRAEGRTVQRMIERHADRAAVKAVCIDLSEAERQSVELVLSGAVIVADKHHVVAPAGRALHEVHGVRRGVAAAPRGCSSAGSSTESPLIDVQPSPARGCARGAASVGCPYE